MEYNTAEIKNNYDQLPHGKAKADAIRQAIEMADQNNDLPFMIYFREEMCHESCFYGNTMEMMVVFPEMLSIIDRYPDISSTQFDTEYKNALDHILWIYKWVVEECASFYQIPMDDCMKFFEDFKKRSKSYGYNLRPYYKAFYYFYDFDKEKADKAFYNFEKTPRDENSDCHACEKNTEIEFYLHKGNLSKALELSEDIEDFRLTCGDHWSAWLRMKILFFDYYMDNCEFEKATEIALILERRINDKKEFQIWGNIINCYAHTKPGRALRVYKKYWRTLEDWRTPQDLFESMMNTCCFWYVIKLGGKETAKLGLDSSFELYNEERIYNVEDLYNYYYNKAEDIARKFDKRNGSDSYIKKLNKSLKIAGRQA